MLAVCVLTRRFNGGADSFESSPFATLSRGAFSASSLVTPICADTSRDRVVPVCNTDLSLPPPPHTASRHARPSPLLVRGVLPCLHLRPDANQPPPLLPAASTLRLRPTA